MSCLHPSLVVDMGIQENGKHKVKFLSRIDDFQTVEEAKRKYEGHASGCVEGHKLLLVPCGHCLECIKRRRKTWAIRCELEAKEHAQNCFITLTYDDEHYPGQIIKKDVQLFIKYLARETGWKQRYFLCGEYGNKGRGHYHLILFGFFPVDAKPVCKTESGVWSYSSKLISDIWKKGFCMVEDFAPAAASYVAGYVEKKLGDRDCFVLMSTRPGIGRSYVEKKLDSIYQYDNLVSKNGSIFGIPRYFDKVAEQCGFDLTKTKRHRLMSVDSMMNQLFRDFGVSSFKEFFDFKIEHVSSNCKRRTCL